MFFLRLLALASVRFRGAFSTERALVFFSFPVACTLRSEKTAIISLVRITLCQFR
jgi:hypothetical protein